MTLPLHITDEWREKERARLRRYNGARLTDAFRERRNAYIVGRRDVPSWKAREIRHAEKRRKRYPEKQRAKQLVKEAIARGELIRPDTCGRCGTVPPRLRDGRTGIHAHHEDYASPLSMEWICLRCHSAEHALSQLAAREEP